MLDQLGVGAARGFEGVGQERHVVESAVRIDPISEGLRLTGQPGGARRSRSKRVSEDAVHEGSLLAVLGDRGRGIGDTPLALYVRRSPCRMRRRDESRRERIAFIELVFPPRIIKGVG